MSNILEHVANVDPAAARTFDKSFLLVTIHRRRPGFNPVLSRKDISCGSMVVDPQRANLRTSLLTPRLKALLNVAYNRVERVVNSFTVPFPIASARVLPIRASGEFAERVALARNGVVAAVDQFAESYDNLVADNRDYWEPILQDDYQKCVGRFLPPFEQLRSRFGVDVATFEIKESGALEVEPGEVSAYLSEWRTNARASIDAALASVIAAPRARLEDALERLGNQLRSGQVLGTAAFNATTSAMQLVRSFSDVADAELLNRVRNLEIGISGATDAAAMTATATEAILARRDDLLAAIAPALEACRNEEALMTIQTNYGLPVRRVAYADFLDTEDGDA